VTLLLTFTLLHIQFVGGSLQLSLMSSGFAEQPAFQPTGLPSISEHHEEFLNDVNNNGEQNAATSETDSVTEEANAAGAEAEDGSAVAGQGRHAAKGENKVNTEQYLSLILMLAIAFIGMHIIKNCFKSTADIILAGTGAIIYIVSELITVFSTKGEIDYNEMKFTIHKDGSISGLQAAALQSQIDSYEDTKKNATVRMALQIAAAICFYLATAAASALTATEVAAAAVMTTWLTAGAASTITSLYAACNAVSEMQSLIAASIAAAASWPCGGCAGPPTYVAVRVFTMMAGCTPPMLGCSAGIGASAGIWASYMAAHPLTYPSSTKWPTLEGFLWSVASPALIGCATPGIYGPYQIGVGITTFGYAATVYGGHLLSHASCVPVVTPVHYTPSDQKKEMYASNNPDAIYDTEGPNEHNFDPHGARDVSEHNHQKAGTFDAFEAYADYADEIPALAKIQEFKENQKLTGQDCNAPIAANKKNQKSFNALEVITKHLNPHIAEVITNGQDAKTKKTATLDHKKLLKSTYRTFDHFGEFYQFHNARELAEANNDHQEDTPELYEVSDKKLHDYLVKREQIAFQNGELKTISTDDFNDFHELYSPTKEPGLSFELNSLFSKSLEVGVDLLFPKAQANLTGYGLGAVGLAIILVLIPGQWQVLDNFMTAEMHRIIAWGIMGTLTSAAAVMSATIIADMKKNIKELKRIKKKLKDHGTGGGTAPVAPIGPNAGGPAGTATIPNNIEFQTTEGTEVIGCPRTNDNGSCINLAEETRRIGNTFRNNPIFGPDGGAMATAAAALGLFGQQALNSSSVSGGDINALPQGLSAFRKIASNAKDKVNNALKKAGKKPIDFASRESGLLKQLKGGALKALKKKGRSPRSAFADLYKLDPEKMAEESPEDKAKMATYDLSNFKAPVIPGFKAPSIKMPKMPKVGGDQSDLTASELSGSKLEEFELNQNDIVQDQGASLFEIIDFRYKKSGYPRLFNKKKKKKTLE
jgi:hypothetical protein